MLGINKGIVHKGCFHAAHAKHDTSVSSIFIYYEVNKTRREQYLFITYRGECISFLFSNFKSGILCHAYYYYACIHAGIGPCIQDI